MTEDCIAASNDGAWAAYSKTMKRGEVFSHIARESYLHGLDFWTLTHHYYVRAGAVREGEFGEGPGWWSECELDAIGAVPAWIVRRR